MKEFIQNFKYILQILYLLIFTFDFKRSYKYKISIVCILRDEAQYIEEWINYYILLGVEHFYIYDNKSKDEIDEILSPYIKSKLVSYKYIDAENYPQSQCYTDAIFKYRSKTKYMLFVDINEFVCMRRNIKFYDFIDNLCMKERYIAGVGINWLCYGSSGFVEKPQGLVIESYLYRAKENYEANKHIKTVCNPRKVYRGSAHVPYFYKHYHNVDEIGNPLYGPFNKDCTYKFISINHYASKSIEEQEVKAKKGFGKTKLKHSNHDMNDVYDPVMLESAHKMKSMYLGNYE